MPVHTIRGVHDTQEDVKFWFLVTSSLSDEYARLEWMTITVLPVLPPPVHLSRAVDSSVMTSEGDLTYKLGDITMASDSIQWSVQVQLKGKEGCLHGNLMGEHVDFSTCTVITGDPNLELDKAGVSVSIGMSPMYPEQVTLYNIAYLQELVQNGLSIYPGARYDARDTGEHIDLQYSNHQVKLMPYLSKLLDVSEFLMLTTFLASHLNPSMRSPYNADFGGDKMNMQSFHHKLTNALWVSCKIHCCGICKYMLQDMFPDWNQVQNIFRVPNWDGHKTLNPILDNGMMVDNSEILYGIVDKKMASMTQGGPILRVVNYGLCHNGFSISITDTFSGLKVVSFITKKIVEKEHRVQEIIDDAYCDCLKSDQYMQEHLKEDNNVKQMVSAGSTDSYSNVSQMSAYVRQWSVEGKYIPFSFCCQTLTHFTKDDFSPEARGEFFFHGVVGQEGLINTADREFEHKVHVDVMDKEISIDNSSLELQDHPKLQSFIFLHADNLTPHHMPNAVQIFHINCHKPRDLKPAYIVDTVYQLMERLLAVLDNDELGREAQATTLATHHVLEEFHLNCEMSEWVLGGIQAKFNQSLFNPGEMCSTLVTQSIGEPIWYNPDPTSTIIEEDSEFMEFFTVLDEDIKSKLQLELVSQCLARLRKQWTF
ncbi:RNA polymerase II largest subunit [Pisolithus orientalis]|uniref:RNA polymerase II largest subunit n=1 Tax=Pisolithus orientalis TaxID=936130 RepID=UPI0022243764|nr:RNA polymerase II largest subunit [Pisolithus orientalis]KAI6032695.1 RNA polymerase II largest subunit [Pisolithus orientalis]